MGLIRAKLCEGRTDPSKKEEDIGLKVDKIY